MSAIDTLRRLCDLLSGAAPTTREVASSLGQVGELSPGQLEIGVQF